MLAVARYHALGNDYLVWCGDAPLTAARAAALCDRHTGPGGDGVLEHVAAPAGMVGCRIWNPDGSVAEKSGNGLRIFARWWVDVGRAAWGAPITLWTGTERVVARVGPDRVEAEMGTACFAPEQVPVLVDRLPQLVGPDGPVPMVPVGLGNPHCVCFVDDVDAVPWRAWGELLEVHAAFPRRTNVQFVSVSDEGLTLRIWERGAGPTQASGSSACAAAAAGLHTGRVAAGRVQVRMQGGIVQVDVDEGYSLRLDGPVEKIGSLELDARWWATRNQPPSGV